MAKSDSDDDLLHDAREAFEQCQDAERDNRRTSLDDIRFAREGMQWPENVLRQREVEGRPCLTINKLPAFIRQVVNDARQNKPSIKVRPVDSGADKATAEVMDGLIRNIEYTSNADTAYDTATECAVTGGIGYIRVGLDYAYDDSFEMDICIKRVSNPFSIYADPNSREADSSDWDVAFVVDRLSKKQFEREYPEAQKTDWDSAEWTQLKASEWFDEDSVLVAEWWTREKVDKPVLLLSDGRVLDPESLEQPEFQIALQAGMLEIVDQRVTKTCKVTQRIMSGVEVLKTREWPGRYIPIVPVYGDEFDIEGKRYFRGLIHNATDAQRMYNYWRSTSVELLALAPKVPFIGPKGAFKSDINRWNTANTRSHAFLEYDGPIAPQRQPLDTGPAAGALQEALNASDDMKSVIGLYDASLGARSNETSGKAILARQREGDVSTFHFVDNMARAVRHTGRIVLDLIPKVYTGKRVIRVMGEDGSQAEKIINAPAPQTDKKGQPVRDETGQVVMAMHDLTVGKYDLVVSTGPSFTTRREEAAMQMTEMIRAFPPAAPVIGPHLAKNLDWPGADEIAEQLEKAASGQLPPEVQKMVEQGKQEIQRLTQENQQLKLDQAAEQQKIAAQAQLDAAKLNGQRQADEAKIAAQMQADMMKVQSAEKLKLIEIESEERIALRKLEVEARLKAEANRLAAENTARANAMSAKNQAEANRMKGQANGKSG